jgi:hypothetical protein
MPERNGVRGEKDEDWERKRERVELKAFQQRLEI